MKDPLGAELKPAVGVTEIPGISKGDAGDEGGGSFLEGLLVGETDLEGDGVVGGCVVDEGLASFIGVGGLDQRVAQIQVSFTHVSRKPD